MHRGANQTPKALRGSAERTMPNGSRAEEKQIHVN
jgi:hypothetical protein